MRAPRNIRNLALVGFMGTGKSSVGRCLAAHFHFRFVDTDDLIEQRAGKSISDIFAQEGQAAFRQLEGEVVDTLAALNHAVIATGGGLVVNPDNLARLKQHALVVCLWASAETIYERVRHASHRPLLRAADPMAEIRRLLAERERMYRQADVLVNTELRSTRDVAMHVMHEFHLATRASS